MAKIGKANSKDAETIRELANITWKEAYGDILAPAQLQYMIDNIYDVEKLRTQISEHVQTYLLIYEEERPVGFASYSPRQEDPEIYKLHKLYCLKETRGRGHGKALMLEVEHAVLAADKTVLDLNVNRYNTARQFYEKLGFEVIYEEDIPVGPYFMNDFVMRKQLQSEM